MALGVWQRKPEQDLHCQSGCSAIKWHQTCRHSLNANTKKQVLHAPPACCCYSPRAATSRMCAISAVSGGRVSHRQAASSAPHSSGHS